MTDETKKLFDAPWTVTVEEIRKDTKRFAVVKNNLDYELVAIDLTHEDAHRLARLPELYDALMYAVHDKCSNCGFAVATNPVDFCKDCMYKTFTDLLKKVRDGE